MELVLIEFTFKTEVLMHIVYQKWLDAKRTYISLLFNYYF